MAKKYTLLIVPRGRGDAKRWEISRLAIFAIALLLIAGTAGLVALSVDGVFYRKAYFDSQFLAKNGRIKRSDSKLKKLADTIGRMERLASKLVSSSQLPTSARPAVGGITELDLTTDTDAEDKEFKIDFIKGIWKSPFSSENESNILETNLSAEELLARADGAEEKLVSLMFTLEKGSNFLTAIPALWPVRGWVTSGFGERRRTHIHKGIDIAASVGTPIYTPGEGIVTYVGYKKGFGKIVKINHGFGLETIYGHCSRIYAKEGQKVGRGIKIAAVGNTGYSTGPHLHYEIRVDGLPVNPLRYIADTL